MKWLVIILIILVVGGGGFFLFNQYIYNQKQADTGLEGEIKPSQAMEKRSQITPISHASMILNIGGQAVYNDPTGGASAYNGQPEANIILISDIHGDHLDPETLTSVTTERTVIVAPKAVMDKLPPTLPGTKVLLANSEKTTQNGIGIEAVPMYNIPESATAPHTKGRGNGYILSVSGQRIYIAGDTSATPEMKALQNIDIAFVPMNLPYTMSVEEAAEGVLAFKPKVVHPYHYRGQDGLADIDTFKELVNAKDPNIQVELLNFYPSEN